MDFETLKLERSNGVATLTFNRPHRLNALNVQLGNEFATALRELEVNEDVRVIVITGAGSRFCAGADLEETFLKYSRMRESGEVDKDLEAMTSGDWAVEVCPILSNLSKVTIAAINGAAVGFGLSLTLACDIRIAAASARMSFPFVKVGAAAEFGSTFFLPRIVGLGKACELMFTGKLIDASEAGEIGLVNQVVPDHDLMEVTRKLAEEIAHTAPLALQFTKKALYRGLSSDLVAQLTMERTGLTLTSRSADLVEGMSAFLEKRAPQFVGR